MQRALSLFSISIAFVVTDSNKTDELKWTVKDNFGNKCEKLNLGEILNFAKGLVGDPAQKKVVLKIVKEEAIFKSINWKNYASNYNAENSVFNYTNRKLPKGLLSNVDEYIQ